MAETAKRITVPQIRAMKASQRIGMLTAYDYPSAKVADAAGATMLLTGTRHFRH
jgi:ketopantoate hydroxymethyltransferase